MADCPKCRKKLKLWHISQYCPYCGANIVFNSFEPQFEKDRRIAEMSIAEFRIKIEKVKKAFLSGTAQKLKIAACVLPAAGLFVPFGSMSISTSLFEKKLTFWVLDMVYNGFLGEGNFAACNSFASAPVFGAALAAVKTAMIFFAVMALAAVGILLSELFCFAGNKRTAASISAFSVIGIIGTVMARVFCGKAAAAAAAAGEILTVDTNVMFLVPVLLFAFAAFAAIFCVKNPPVLVFREGDELRAEYRRKLKNGEIELLDIPAPIYESEEDKAEREKLIRGAYHMDEEA